jgi:hypothetical protein
MTSPWSGSVTAGEHPRSQTCCLLCAVWLATQPRANAGMFAEVWGGPLDEFAAAVV